jgi:hypothetical protein
MNGLYPIIRRVRRPLLPVDEPAAAVPVIPVVKAPETVGVTAEAKNEVKADAAEQGAQAETEQPKLRKRNGKAASVKPAE